MALTTEERLTEARDAYHALATGQAVAEARDSDGSLVRYTKADMGRLLQYITQLEAEIAAAAGTPKISGPMRVFS